MMTAKMGERDSREEIQKAFKLFDDDNTGFITLKNLKRVAKELVSICMATLRSMQPCGLPTPALSSSQKAYSASWSPFTSPVRMHGCMAGLVPISDPPMCLPLSGREPD